MRTKVRKIPPKPMAISTVDETRAKVMIFRSSEPTDIFYKQKAVSPFTGEDCVLMSNPLRLLLSQKGMEQLLTLGEDNAQKWYKTLLENSKLPNELAELTKDLKPEELREMIRSRYIQSYSELDNWCKAMHSNEERFHEEIEIVRKGIIEREENAKRYAQMLGKADEKDVKSQGAT